MTKKRRHTRLGNPATAMAVTQVVRENPDLVKSASHQAQRTVRTILIIGGIGVGILVGRKAYKYVKDKVRAGKEGGSTIGATLSDSQALIYANSLYSAMKGAGTDENAVMAVFQACINDADVNLIIKKFSSKDGETLSQWINNDFDSSGKEKYINSVLRMKGITKQF